MASHLATRGEGGRTRGSEQEKPGRPSGWPHGAQANAGSPGNSHLGGVFKHAGCGGAELAAFGVQLRAQRRLTGRAPRQTGTPPPPPRRAWKQVARLPENKEPVRGRCGRGPRGAVRPQTAAADPRGVRSRRGGGFPPRRGPSLLSRAGLERPACALGERGRRLDGWTWTPSPRPARGARTPADGTDASRAAMPSAGRQCRGVRVRRPGPSPPPSKPRTPTRKPQLVRPPRHMRPAAFAGSEAGPSLRAPRPPTVWGSC